MNIIRCKNGHFFDGDKYQTCPHCGSQEPVKKERSNPIGKLFERKTKEPVSEKPAQQTPAKPASAPIGKTPSGQPAPVPQPANFRPKEEPRISRERFAPDTPVSDPARPAFGEFRPDPSEDKTLPVKSDPTPLTDRTIDLYSATVTAAEPPQPAPQPVPQPRPEPQQSLRDAVNFASASSEEKTVSVFQSMTHSQAAQQAKPDRRIDPVVGWLVCVSGPHFGEAFALHAGKNPIGRSESNRVVLSLDGKVSREKQAIVIYEPRKREFFLCQGDSNGLTYLNGEFVLEQRTLKARDTLEAGDTKLLFVPLCDSSFSWDEFQN